MAGAGFKTFAVGEVLTAENVNTYLMQQSVMVFADSGARGSALGTATGAGTALAEGMVSYLSDLDEVQFFDGTAWARVGGKVLQVVQASSTATVTITSGTFSSTGVSVSITPEYSSSKVLVLASLAAEADAGTASSFATEVAISRDGTELIDWRFSSSFDGTIASSLTNTYLDSPSTTSATTYAIEARLVSTGSSRLITAQENGAESTITAIEIAG